MPPDVYGGQGQGPVVYPGPFVVGVTVNNCQAVISPNCVTMNRSYPLC